MILLTAIFNWSVYVCIYVFLLNFLSILCFGSYRIFFLSMFIENMLYIFYFILLYYFCNFFCFVLYILNDCVFFRFSLYPGTWSGAKSSIYAWIQSTFFQMLKKKFLAVTVVVSLYVLHQSRLCSQAYWYISGFIYDYMCELRLST